VRNTLQYDVTKQLILLIRHGSAVKNDLRQHGGEGGPLVPNGKQEILNASAFINQWDLRLDRIAYAPRIQCEESATILARELGIPAFRDEELRPVFLGVVDGLSEHEVEHTLPDVAARLAEWRAGRLEVCDLAIPEAEVPEDFYKRGLAYIHRIANQEQNILVVATRSTLVLLGNVLLRRTPEPYGGYKEIQWATAGILGFRRDQNWYGLSENHSTLNL
jgi:broad specificity phosphatase PhoE